MKVTINLNYNNQTLGKIVGKVNAGIKDARNCCLFTLDSFNTEIETSKEEKDSILNVLMKPITEEGYSYFFTKNKNNLFSKCPFVDKVINIELIPEKDNFKLRFNDKMYAFR
jgi:hypothetical protein